MNEHSPLAAEPRRWNGLFLIFGICALGLSIAAYYRPNQQMAPLDWIVYLLGGTAAVFYGLAKLPIHQRPPLRRRATTLAVLLTVICVVYVLIRGLF